MTRYARNHRAATLAALFVVPLTALAVGVLPPGGAAVRAERERERPEGAERAHRLLKRMMEAERRRAVAGREVTDIAGGPESEQRVKRDPRRGMRIEFIRPTQDILVDNRRRSWRLQNGKKRLIERPSRLREKGRAVYEIMARLRRGELQADMEGQDLVAGRVTDIVRIGPPPGVAAPARRFWIDRETGLRLRTEERAPSGRVLSSSYFLEVDVSPRLRDEDFAEPDAPGVKRVVEDRQVFGSVHEAQKAVHFSLRRPGFLPAGFKLREVAVMKYKRKKMAVQRFANGLTVLSLFQTDADLPPRLRDRAGKRGNDGQSPRRGPRVITWRDGADTFALVGNFPEDDLQRIADSVR